MGGKTELELLKQKISLKKAFVPRLSIINTDSLTQRAHRQLSHYFGERQKTRVKRDIVERNKKVVNKLSQHQKNSIDSKEKTLRLNEMMMYFQRINRQ